MSDGIWVPLYPERFLSSRKVRRMDATDLGIYMSLLMEEWIEGGALPDDDNELAMAGRAPITDVRRVLDLCFLLTAEGWENDTLEGIRREQLDKLERARRSGKKGAETRWSKRKSHSRAMDAPKGAHGVPIGVPDEHPPACGGELQACAKEQEPQQLNSGAIGCLPNPNGIRREESKEIHMSDHAAFERAWVVYPKRPNNNKSRARKSWRARIKEGVPADDMQAGVERYLAYCKATNRIGTEFVKQASTFFGPDRHWENDYRISEPEYQPITLANQW